MTPAASSNELPVPGPGAKGESPPTVVVNVKREPCDVYVGRAMPGRAGSPFANPFRIEPGRTRAQAIEAYRGWLRAQPRLLAELESLRGKRLGCWCKPYACHADVLVELIEGRAAVRADAQASLF